MHFTAVSLLAVALILARWLVELWLAQWNRRHVQAHAIEVPAPFRGMIDEPTYARSVEYTLARNRFSQFADTWQTLVLLVVLFSGVLPWAYEFTDRQLGESTWAMAAFLFAAGLALALPGLPLDWHEQFRLEQAFGFNTTTPKTWWLDRLKGFLLALLLGWPLLVLLLKFVEWTGEAWWLWAWAAFLAFQLVMLVLAPVLILPWFNKFTPLPEGSLRDRLFNLAARAQFHARSIQVMDGSKRSRHSNAFFTGFGRWRKIVLFDTLLGQLTEAELEAVLAHEIGHYRLKHIPKMLAASALGSLAGFGAVSVLSRQEWFFRAFGFEPGSIVPALLLFGLLAGTVAFWFSPLAHWWSRRYEYQADAFAARVMGDARLLTSALRKLSEKNLSNLTPHPIYSAVYYSHPTLLERERALTPAMAAEGGSR
jgi:STE24 endopeptidase